MPGHNVSGACFVVLSPVYHVILTMGDDMPKRTKPLSIEPETPGHAIVSTIVAHATRKASALRRIETRGVDIVEKLESYAKQIRADLRRVTPNDRNEYTDLVDLTRELVDTIAWIAPNLHPASLISAGATYEVAYVREQWARETFARYEGPDRDDAAVRLKAFDAFTGEQEA